MGAGARVVEWRKRVKLRAVVYKGGCCIACGYQRCVAALAFHHLDPKQKDSRIGSGTPQAWAKIKTELDKCVVLCHNCHMEVHHGALDLTPHMHKNPTPQEGDVLLSRAGIQMHIKRPNQTTCSSCGGGKSIQAIRCRACAAKLNPSYKTHTTWPATDELRRMVAETSFLAVGRLLGVSDNAVRKRLRNHP